MVEAAAGAAEGLAVAVSAAVVAVAEVDSGEVLAAVVTLAAEAREAVGKETYG